MKQKKLKIKEVGYGRFAAGAMMELWLFRLVTGVILVIPAVLLKNLAEWTLSNDSVLTTANMGLIMNWRLPVLLVFALLFVIFCIWIEMFSQVSMCSRILTGEKTGVFPELGRGFKAMMGFISPLGILFMILVILPMPLCGIGFSLSATKDFYIPDFIQSVIRKNPLYFGLEIIVTAAVLFLNFRFALAFHAAVIDHKKAKDALKESWRLTGEHFKEFTLRFIRVVVIAAVVFLGVWFVFSGVPEYLLDDLQSEFKTDHEIDVFEMDVDELDEDSLDQDLEIIAYRIAAACTVFVGGYIVYIAGALCTSSIMLFFTRAYYEFTDRKPQVFYKQGGFVRTFRNAGFVLGSLVFFILIAIFAGVFFDQVFEKRDPVRIVAHRTGGILASENSLKGIDKASHYGCYGSETDIQRTKDGYYVINHDNDFKRLTGVAKKPGDMTLAEIKELRIKDTTGNGELLSVPTLEELLDRGKEDKIVLFLELKGVSADRKMADDIVKAVRERDMTDQVVLISLNFDAIEYAEQTYPEFKTGLLIFGTFGDVTKLNCDLIIMEEEMSTTSRIWDIHNAGKEALVWTVNKEEDLQNFLDKDIDGIITDEIIKAIVVEDELEKRTDIEILEDRTSDMFD